MRILTNPRLIITALLLAVTALQGKAATLSPPLVILPSSTGSLSASSNLGFPGAFWLITIANWEQTGDISIQVNVDTSDNIPAPVLHTVFLNVSNSTSNVWDRFEIDLSGPAKFSNSPLAPVTFNVPANSPAIDEQKIEFDGFSMAPSVFTATIGFGLDVTPPVSGEDLVITLRPVAVIPEPSTGAVVTAMLLFTQRSSRRIRPASA